MGVSAPVPRTSSKPAGGRLKQQNKSNRQDGSYATGDLYIPHRTRRDVWKYVGRGDEVIVMVRPLYRFEPCRLTGQNNGEKASPAPIETVLRSCPAIADALVVGPNRDQLGAILFLKPSSSLSEPDLGALLERANAASPSFAQISADMCLFLPAGEGKALPKSSKGTVQRGMAYDVFTEEIDRLYGGSARDGSQGGREGPPKRKRTLQEVERDIERAILAVAPARNGDTLGRDADLFNWGVDSLMATRLQYGIQKVYGPAPFLADPAGL